MKPFCNCFALRQATRRVTQLYDQALMSLDLRATQYSLLSQVEGMGPISLNALANVMVMGRATLGHNVRPLVARDLLQLEVGADRRSREISITKEGRHLLKRARPFWNEAQRIFEDEIGEETAASLRTLLHQVATTDFPRPSEN